VPTCIWRFLSVKITWHQACDSMRCHILKVCLDKLFGKSI
jgi:hypothetical protein